MANLSKIKRDRMIEFLEKLKNQYTDDEAIRAFNEIENQLREKKYGLVWEEHEEQVDIMLKENIPVFCEDEQKKIKQEEKFPYHFIVEGDNLQALYLLEKTHCGKIDCIYIDPPYNTGAKDWKYNNDYVDINDTYRHSKWLSMMKNRLLIAKRLLNPNSSVLICTIDEKEYLHLGCLLEELFPEAKIQMITSVISRNGTNRENEFSRVDEYLFICRLGTMGIVRTNDNMLSVGEEGVIKRVWFNFMRTSTPRSKTKGQFFPIYIDPEKKAITRIGEALKPEDSADDVVAPDGQIAVFPIKDDNTEATWGAIPETTKVLLDNGFLRVGTYDKKTNRWNVQYVRQGDQKRIKAGEIEVIGRAEDGSLILEHVDASQRIVFPKTVWNRKSHDATEHGTRLLKLFMPGNKFSYPKSLYAVRDVIKFFVADKPNAVIIDFFAGSGTTLHAVNLLNRELGGNRKCILVTNNEVSYDEEKSLEKRGIKRGDEEWESLGIARSVTWPRTVCSISGKDTNGNIIEGNYLDTEIPISEGFEANVKYFKCGWTPRKPEDYLLSNALCLHIREMIEIQNALEIDNVKNVLILNKDDFRHIIQNPDIYTQIENVWINQNIILNSEEVKLLEKKGFKYIPKEFFGKELREVAE